jgi:IS30 family transposase
MAKHLNYDNRLDIEKGLKENYSLSEIARILNRHRSTISREITLRSTISKKGCYGRNYNACIHRYDCDLNHICEERRCINKRTKFCRFCNVCNDKCEYFKEDVCRKLSKSPYVCNGCDDRNKCILTKRIYSINCNNKLN